MSQGLEPSAAITPWGGGGGGKHRAVLALQGLIISLVVSPFCSMQAKNLVQETASGKPTRTAQAVKSLQDSLPKARVVYCSATGASEPRHLGYMTRLGLWGEGMPFSSFSDFLTSMKKHKNSALELLAMDLKSRGIYLSRTLSFRGCEFEIVEVDLSQKMKESYDKASMFWLKLDKLIDALKARSDSKLDRRLYWGMHQRFFRYLSIAAKVDKVVELTKKALDAGDCVVIGLQGTGEAVIEETVRLKGEVMDDLISGPREMLHVRKGHGRL